jgi:hypothetical protein
VLFANKPPMACLPKSPAKREIHIAKKISN